MVMALGSCVNRPLVLIDVFEADIQYTVYGITYTIGERSKLRCLDA